MRPMSVCGTIHVRGYYVHTDKSGLRVIGVYPTCLQASFSVLWSSTSSSGYYRQVH